MHSSSRFAYPDAGEAAPLPRHEKKNPPGGVVRAGHLIGARGSGGGSADRGLYNLEGRGDGLAFVCRRHRRKGSCLRKKKLRILTGPHNLLITLGYCEMSAVEEAAVAGATGATERTA